MDFPWQNCLVAAENFSDSRFRRLLAISHDMTYILLNLRKLQEQIREIGEKKILAQYLSGPEQTYWDRLTSDKRKREWIGGRLAAKYGAARLLAHGGTVLSSAELTVIPDKNGRPFLAAATPGIALPDISISHSGRLAAAMAVSKGICGIDIQKNTDRVVKVRERFCTPDEEYILKSYFKGAEVKETLYLTRLWAAKETLRKAANLNSLPGFLELELTGIDAGASNKTASPWRFIFRCRHSDMKDITAPEKCGVVITCVADYTLALTARNDTVG